MSVQLPAFYIVAQCRSVAVDRVGADIVELHTGEYADCPEAEREQQLHRIVVGAKQAYALGLQVNAGHGLHYQNVDAIAALLASI